MYLTTHTHRGLATCTSTVVLVAMTATQDRQEANKLQGGRGSTLSLPTEGEGAGSHRVHYINDVPL